MKIVLNKCYGGFSLSQFAQEKLGLDSPLAYIERTDNNLINLVEQFPLSVSGACARLVVVKFPDKATDYYIEEYDGMEKLFYVLDGKINII